MMETQRPAMNQAVFPGMSPGFPLFTPPHLIRDSGAHLRLPLAAPKDESPSSSASSSGSDVARRSLTPTEAPNSDDNSSPPPSSSSHHPHTALSPPTFPPGFHPNPALMPMFPLWGKYQYYFICQSRIVIVNPLHMINCHGDVVQCSCFISNYFQYFLLFQD